MLVTESPPTITPEPLCEGRALGGYQVVRTLATGGMGSVFAAERRGPGGYVQRVALKVPHPHLWGLSVRRAEFAQEAQLGIYVNHPNVCGVVDFGEVDGIPYMALDFVRGETFAAVARSFALRTDLTAERALMLSLFVVATACEGLEAIHVATDHGGRALSIVHCDVCPENMMVGYNGSVRVIDLGVAVALAAPTQAQETPWRGRCAYMAPERVDGQPFDRRADIWSLGVMLCELLTGQNPFARDTTLETILAIRRNQSIGWPAHVSAELSDIAQRALARAPADRFTSARQLGQALISFLSSRCQLDDLSAELSQHMQRAFEQAASRSYAPHAAAPDQSRNDSSRLSYATATNTSRPTRARHPFELSARFAENKRWWLPAAASALALLIALHHFLAAPRDANHAGDGAQRALLAATPEAASQTGAAGSASTAARLPATAPHSRPPRDANARKPAVKRWHAHAASAPEPVSRDAAATQAHGVAVLTAASGWADIYEGSKKLGRTPLRVELSSGLHRLTLRPYGEAPARSMMVSIKPAQTVRVDLALQW